MLDLHRQHRHHLDRHQRGMAGAILLGVVVAGVVAYYASKRGPKRLPLTRARHRRVHLEGSVNIDRSAEDIYNYWRNFSQLPDVMTFVDRVEDRGAGRTHWVAKGPLGRSIEWDSEVVDDIPNQRLSWHSLQGSDIQSWGDVQFRENPHGHGTDVVVHLNFEPPGRIAGAAVAHFLGSLEKAMLNQNLRNLKTYMETGEIPPDRNQGDGAQDHRQPA